MKCFAFVTAESLHDELYGPGRDRYVESRRSKQKARSLHTHQRLRPEFVYVDSSHVSDLFLSSIICFSKCCYFALIILRYGESKY